MKEIDLHTYGKTPACRFLAFQVSQIGDARLANRVGQSLTHFRDLTNSLERSNFYGVMNQHHVSSFAAQLRHVVDGQHAKFMKKNEIVANLVRNIMIGELKSLQRRGAQAKYKFKEMQRSCADVPGDAMSDLVLQLRPRVTDFKDSITPETLTKKSLVKLQRKGKLSTLY
jgi:hypothetical protein